MSPLPGTLFVQYQLLWRLHLAALYVSDVMVCIRLYMAHHTHKHAHTSTQTGTDMTCSTERKGGGRDTRMQQSKKAETRHAAKARNKALALP